MGVEPAKRTCLAGVTATSCGAAGADAAVGCCAKTSTAAMPTASCTAATAGVAGWEDKAERAEAGAEPAGSPGTAGSDTDAGVAATVRFSTDIEGGGWAVTEGADLASSP